MTGLLNQRCISEISEVVQDAKKEFEQDLKNRRDLDDVAEEEISKLLDSDLFRFKYATYTTDGWKTATEAQIQIFNKVLKCKATKKPAAGDVTMEFARAVLSVLGTDRSANEMQRKLVEDICSVIETNRPFPTMLWVDFVRARLEKKPLIVSYLLALLFQSPPVLRERIKNVAAQQYKEVGLASADVVCVWGYSRTITDALRGLPLDISRKLKIFTPVLHRGRNRDKADGILLRDALKDRFPLPEVVEDETALDCVRRGESNLVLMGCVVTGLRRTEKLELVNSKGSLACAEAAFDAKICVVVVAAAYKCWPTRTFEKYRPLMLQDKSRDIISGELITWFMREDDVFTQDTFMSGYNNRFLPGGIPRETIQAILEKKCENKAALDAQIGVIAKELEIEEQPLRDLPAHFLRAQEYYKKQLKNEEWVKEYLGKHVAIIGNEVVDSDEKFDKLSPRVRKEYGYGPIYMAEVLREPRKQRLGPRIKG